MCIKIYINHIHELRIKNRSESDLRSNCEATKVVAKKAQKKF